MDIWDSFIRMISSLALVLGLMIGLVFLVKRLRVGRLFAQPGSSLITVLGQHSLAPKQSIALVSVAGEFLIVGSTSNELVSLGRVTNPEAVQRILCHISSRPPAGTQAEVNIERKNQPHA